MQPDFSQIGPFLIAAVVAFAIYRRFRRNFGRQPLRRARMIVRMALLAVAASALLPMALRSAQFSAAEFAGAAIGIALGVWGAQRSTRAPRRHRSPVPRIIRPPRPRPLSAVR
jgi:hypothetical protein